jgi:predicted  nucleic acid-binding Zn-ribbon protein
LSESSFPLSRSLSPWCCSLSFLSQAAFLSSQNERRDEIRSQISKELAAIRESKLKLEEKKRELGSIEETYTDKLADLQRGLEKEMDQRKAMEGELVRVKKELEETVKDRPNKIHELKEQIELVKSEKTLFQNNLTNIRKELLRLQQSYQSVKRASWDG